MNNEVSFMVVEFVGGPLDGAIEPFMAMPAAQLLQEIREESAYDPLAGTPYASTPAALEHWCMRGEHEGKTIYYAFGTPWMTSDGRRLRIEYLPPNLQREMNGEGDLVLA